MGYSVIECKDLQIKIDSDRIWSWRKICGRTGSDKQMKQGNEKS